jgi:TPR repeat protein
MGQWYKTGEYTLEQDSKVSMDWFDMAAGQGDTVGQYEYGLCFLHERMEMDDMSIGNAALWFGKSADQGKIMSSCTI